MNCFNLALCLSAPSYHDGSLYTHSSKSLPPRNESKLRKYAETTVRITLSENNPILCEVVLTLQKILLFQKLNNNSKSCFIYQFIYFGAPLQIVHKIFSQLSQCKTVRLKGPDQFWGVIPPALVGDLRLAEGVFRSDSLDCPSGEHLITSSAAHDGLSGACRAIMEAWLRAQQW